MKNLLLIATGLFFLSYTGYAQEEETKEAPKLEKKKVVQKKQVQLKPAKKAIAEPKSKKVKKAAVRKENPATRKEEDQ